MGKMSARVSWGIEVIADSTDTWVGNQFRLPSRPKAEEYGRDLAARWTAVRKWRVVRFTANAMRSFPPTTMGGGR